MFYLFKIKNNNHVLENVLTKENGIVLKKSMLVGYQNHCH